MRTALLWVAVFGITVLEVWIATWEGRADRQSTSATHSRFSHKAAFWAATFEVVLLIDVVLIVREGWTIIVPVVVGAYWGKWRALERRRAKWRARVKRRKRDIPSAPPAEAVSPPTS